MTYATHRSPTSPARLLSSLSASLLALGLGLVLACDGPKNIGDETDSGGACMDGDEKPAGDGCNTCFCEGGEWACTEIGCDPSDTSGGDACTPGDMMPAGDGCNTCECTEDATWACTQMACEPQGCEPGDMKPADDGCNTCECTEDGEWACTEEGCDAPPADACPADAPDDDYWVSDAVVDGDVLTVQAQAGGGCEMHVWLACWDENFYSAGPDDPPYVHTDVTISHESNDDPCEAIVSETLQLDLTPIKLALQDGDPDVHGTVALVVGGDWTEELLYHY